MPPRAKGPRLYLDSKRKTWVIRDGANFIRTGCLESDRKQAERELAHYIGRKYEPKKSAEPLIDDVLIAYADEHVSGTRAKENTAYNISSLAKFWSGKSISEITAATCREYGSGRTKSASRRDLEVLRAAINHWHKFHGPLANKPVVVLPARQEAREKWLTKEQARSLRREAMKWPHLYRFIVIGFATGTRSGAIVKLKWEWIDLKRGVMRRKAYGEADTNKKAPPVRLGRSLIRLMRKWRKADGRCEYVIHIDGKPVKKLRRTWAQAAMAAGLEWATPHMMRHSRASWLMQEGVDMWEAAGHLGMSMEILTKVYAKHHPDWQKRAAEV